MSPNRFPQKNDKGDPAGGPSSPASPRKSVSTALLLSEARSSSSLTLLRTLSSGEEDEAQAWCIVICCFLVNIAVMGFLKCLGILSIELQTAFKASPADVSVLVSITSCLNSIAGPFACYLVLKCTSRTIAFIGTVSVSVGLMISYFATSMGYLHFSIGFLVGAGSGFTYSPGVILIGNYFQKNRGMANGIIASGSPVGGMIMPYLLNFLSTHLGIRGALLILGALMMNAVACTLSYKPYSSPRRSRNKKKKGEGNRRCSVKKTKGEINIRSDDGSSSKSFESGSDESSGPEVLHVEGPGTSKQKQSRSSPVPSTGSVIVYKINEKYGNTNSSVRSKGILKMPPYWRSSPEGGPPQKRGKLFKLSGTGQNIASKISQTEIRAKKGEEEVKRAQDFCRPLNNLIQRVKGSSQTSSARLVKPPERQSLEPAAAAAATTITTTTTEAGTPTLVGSTFSTSQGPTSTLGGSSIESTIRRRLNSATKKDSATPTPTPTKKLPAYILSLDHSCVIMWSNDNLAKELVEGTSTRGVNLISIISGTERPPEDNAQGEHGGSGPPTSADNQAVKKKTRCCSKVTTFLRKSPLSNPTFLLLLFSNASTAIATTNILLLIPAIDQHRGLSKGESSTVYLIVSICDLVARLLGSFVYDRGYLSPKTIFSGGLCLSGMSSIGIAVANDFSKMCGFGAMFGFSCGLHIGIFGTLLAEVVGVPMLPLGYAFSMILNGILQFSFINISGKILSGNSSAFHSLYFFYGFTLLCGGSLWLIPFILTKFQKLRGYLKGADRRVPSTKEVTVKNSRTTVTVDSASTGEATLE